METPGTYTTPRGRELTRRLSQSEQALLDWIIEYKRLHDGNSPTLREMIGGVGHGSTSSMNFRLSNLQLKGRIEIELTGKARCIKVIGGRWEYRP